MAKDNKPFRGQDIPKAKINKDSLKRLLKLFNFMGKQKWLFYFGTLFLLVSAGTSLIFPKLTGDFVDASSISKDQINKIGYLFAILFIVQAISSYLRVWTFVKATEGMVWRLRNQLYSKIISLPMHFFHQNRTGDLLSRFGSDITQVQETFVTFLATFIRQILIGIGGVILLFFTSPDLALVMLSIIPPVVIISLFFGRYIRKISRTIQDETADAGTILEESISGIQIVKSFANELYETVRFGNKSIRIRDISIRRGIYRGLFSSFIIMCLFGGLIFIAWRAFQLQAEGVLTIGDILKFMIYTMFVGASIGGISDQYAQIQKSVGAADRILDILEQESETDLATEESSKPVQHLLKGNLTVSNLVFAYPSRPDLNVLQDISFEAKSGEKIAIVGASGAGKSTIVQLLLGFYTPQKGAILFDETQITDIDFYDLRKQIGLVPQDIGLFGGTIYNNILYGNTQATENEIHEAAKQANALEFIERFPDKYQTVVGDRGVQLSGGQRQRIAIARAFLKKPVFLILDEATSSLDSESELVVQDALEKLMEGRTSIIIAHRLSTIKNSDKIIVLEAGKIIETGSPASLLDNPDSKFYTMWKTQFELR
ncbi:MAG: ABC transporter ATP-binding protein/permease [Bacteroidia bacterium]|nr:ABC transporter ATP-binding protein [Bacteroidia bacterium]MCO5254606.1 ABC transporter ATP-binding protein/permease [Bacteroidota bacterium]MCZ2131395.1 ABC transporter ATP-binding protein/permease [Bacteroidia bacterium]